MSYGCGKLICMDHMQEEIDGGEQGQSFKIMREYLFGEYDRRYKDICLMHL